MADTVTTQTAAMSSVPNGTVIATDDAGAGGHIQLIKIAISTDGSATLIPADGTKGLRTYRAVASTATITDVSASTSSATLVASNASRLGATVFNDSSSVLYVKFGATASSTGGFTVKMSAGDYFEVPTPVYTGVIDGIWATSTGAARVTELT